MSQSFTDLINQIEELRIKLIKIKVGKAYSDPEVVVASQELDEVLDKYQELLLKDRASFNDFRSM